MPKKKVMRYEEDGDLSWSDRRYIGGICPVHPSPSACKGKKEKLRQGGRKTM